MSIKHGCLLALPEEQTVLPQEHDQAELNLPFIQYVGGDKHREQIRPGIEPAKKNLYLMRLLSVPWL